MKKPLEIGIVGCGTAGATAALFLARAGHRATVFEAVEQPGPVGAGIMIQPTGLSVLARLGLDEEILLRGARVDRLRCVTGRRRSVIDLAYADLAADAFGIGLHRGVLFSVLFGAVQREPRVELRCGISIEKIVRTREQYFLVDEDRGGRYGPYDLVVVADGARSRIRAARVTAERAREYEWGALWFIGEDPAGEFDRTLFQIVDGAEVMLGLLPSGLGPSGESKRVSLFWSIRADRVDAWREGGLDVWKRRVVRYEPRTEPLLAQIESIDQVLFARYWDVVLDRWDDGGIVYLGDAAHAMSPQLGQGANLALVDAMVLADSLEGAATVKDGLAEYSDARRAHLGYYQWATRFLTPFFQSDVSLLAVLRDAFMGLSCKLPIVRDKMLRTMCGLERGIVIADALPMPELPKLLPAPERRAAE